MGSGVAGGGGSLRSNHEGTRTRCKKGGAVEGSEGGATSLVAGLAYQSSSTIVGSEWVVVVVWGNGPNLSDDEDAVEDMGSRLERPKKWDGVVPVPVVGSGKTVSSLDEIRPVVVDAN